MTGSRFRGTIGVLIAGSMLLSSTAAVAATPAPAYQPDPWAVLSVMSGGASAMAVCGAAAGTAASAAQMGNGCVLPQVDQAPSVPTPQQAIPPVAPEAAGLGISPLLIALIAILGGIGLYFVLHHHHHNNSPA
jgi:hypothetical protein